MLGLQLGGQQWLQWGLWGGRRGLGRGGWPGQRRGGEEGHSSRQGRGRAGRSARGLANGPVVEEEGALLDEELDDGLVGACGCQRIHGAEIGPHERGPEADGQVLAGHEVHFVVVADPGGTGALVKPPTPPL